jgi:hypothetical protein
MRFFKFGAPRLSDAEVQEIQDQVRHIHNDLVKHGPGDVPDLHAYFVEQDYWPVDRVPMRDEKTDEPARPEN